MTVGYGKWQEPEAIPAVVVSEGQWTRANTSLGGNWYIFGLVTGCLVGPAAAAAVVPAVVTAVSGA